MRVLRHCGFVPLETQLCVKVLISKSGSKMYTQVFIALHQFDQYTFSDPLFLKRWKNANIKDTGVANAVGKHTASADQFLIVPCSNHFVACFERFSNCVDVFLIAMARNQSNHAV